MADYLTVIEVLSIHASMIREFGGTEGVRDLGALEAAVFRPQTGYYDGPVEEAAALAVEALELVNEAEASAKLSPGTAAKVRASVEMIEGLLKRTS